MEFSDEEIAEFKTEATELLDAAERSLLALDGGEPFTTHYDAVFRAFHSIKGAAGMMEIPALQAHMHQLENTLTEQKSKSVLAKPYIDLFLKGADAARTLLNGGSVRFDYTVGSAPAKTVAAAPKIESLGTVVVVDDEPDLVQIFEQILGDAKITTIGTTRPEEVLQLVEAHKPDAVVSDVAMPKLSGLQLLAAMTENHPDVPVIFVSGHLSREALVEAIQLGVHGVIEKPFQPNRVIEACLNAIRKHQLVKLLNRSVNLLMYQFPDLNECLKSNGKDDVRGTLKREIHAVLEQRRALRALAKPRS